MPAKNRSIKMEYLLAKIDVVAIFMIIRVQALSSHLEIWVRSIKETHLIYSQTYMGKNILYHLNHAIKMILRVQMPNQ